jgi:hypothetical protein
MDQVKDEAISQHHDTVYTKKVGVLVNKTL